MIPGRRCLSLWQPSPSFLTHSALPRATVPSLAGYHSPTSPSFWLHSCGKSSHPHSAISAGWLGQGPAPGGLRTSRPLRIASLIQPPDSLSRPRLLSLAFWPHPRPHCPLLFSLPSDSVLLLTGAPHWPLSPCLLDSPPVLGLFHRMPLALSYPDLPHSSQSCSSPVCSRKLLLPAQPSPRLVFLLPALTSCCSLLARLVWWQEMQPSLLVWGSDTGEAGPLSRREQEGRET